MNSKETTTFSRKELFDLVWSESLLSLSKRYCISDNGIRKVCKSMNIPLPPNGYWQKVKYGKSVTRDKLPKDYDGKNEVVLNPRTENCSEYASALSAQTKLATEILADDTLNLNVPDRLSSCPDPLILSTKEYRNAVKRYDWKRGGRYPESDEVLNINVSDESLQRAYRILDTVIKILKSRKHEIAIRYDKTYAVILGEEIEFRIRERNKESEEKTTYGSRILKPTGEFIFQYGSWLSKQVTDGKQGLESKIATIIAKLEIEGKKEHERRIEREKQRKIREEQERIAKEIKERKDQELKKFTDLFRDAIQAHHASILRQYIELLNENSSPGEDWINWAHKKVDWYDPLVNEEDLELDDSHKEKAFLTFLSYGK